uniref:Ovule protein n=1 Tax=Panagrolaimus sp. JU765 TaxID=591449 RepID=A0AC34PVL9_9BILA
MLFQLHNLHLKLMNKVDTKKKERSNEKQKKIFKCLKKKHGGFHDFSLNFFVGCFFFSDFYSDLMEKNIFELYDSNF